MGYLYPMKEKIIILFIYLFWHILKRALTIQEETEDIHLSIHYKSLPNKLYLPKFPNW